MEGRQLNPIM
uniref:Uncharacterized protein n=1 Tax=Anguilla anguilla TaxID=7936 RepID=A0A0E9US02_ANGAN